MLSIAFFLCFFYDVFVLNKKGVFFMVNFDKKEEKIIEKIAETIEKLDVELEKIDSLNEKKDKKHEFKKWL